MTKTKEKVEIPAMMEDDMFAFLKKNGYWGALKDGYIKCPCGKTVTQDNLVAMRGDKKNDRILFFESIICATEDHE